MKNSEKSLNLSFIVFVLLLVLIGAEGRAAENLQQNKGIKTNKNTALLSRQTISVGKTHSNGVSVKPRVAAQAPKTKQMQTGETMTAIPQKTGLGTHFKTKTPVTVNPSHVTKKISEKKSYQVKAGPIKPNAPISNQQGHPVRQYRVEKKPVKLTGPARTKTPLAVVDKGSIKTWTFDKSGNRVEGQGK